MLDQEIKSTLKVVFAELSNNYTLAAKSDSNNPKQNELTEMLKDITECSNKINYTLEDGDSIEFSILKNDTPTGITFRAVPGGHEFNSLILAILNADEKGKNLPDEFIVNRIKRIKGKIDLTTYMSLSCTNCPEVVQALNIIAILNKDITHQATDGALYEEEVNSLNIQAVPTVYANDKEFYIGKGTLANLLDKLESNFGINTSVENHPTVKHYDLIIAGGGPAGVTAAIYSARKGLNVAVIANKIGGQVNETMAIENIPSVIETSGTQLANDLRVHAQKYKIDILENRIIEKFSIEDKNKVITIRGGEIAMASQIIIATGANWRRLNVPGESEYIGKGVAFCPHCDGPLFKDRDIAVVGGGNSGVEAAIDLAGICTHVTLFEFLDTLKADRVLVKKLELLNNVTIYKSTAITEIIGDGKKVIGIRKRDRLSNKEEIINVDGIFVQIGLLANSQLFKTLVKTNIIGEIEINNNCKASIDGVYAAGDVTDIAYKQIVISMGEGAKAALAAFEERIREL